MRMIELFRRISAIALVVLFFSSISFAQTVTVTGTVVDTKNEPVIGASVAVMGVKGKGAMTDLDGKFRITGISKEATLRVSFVGMRPQEIPLKGKTHLNIVLVEDSELLDEVVVTALGIKRAEKSLSYNVQEIRNTELTKAKTPNFLNALSGKIAGVNINASSSGVGGATKVVMRGTKSIEKDNGALYVIDGVPMLSFKSTKEGTGRFNSNGTTEGMADINPDDIASISVLTGASAAALYGSAAANGAILITTKKGQAGGIKINYGLNSDWGAPLILPRLQTTYGSDGNISSWGAPLASGHKPFDPRDFFQIANNITHTLSVSGGTDKNQTYLSASATNAKGLVPNNTYNKYNFGARNTTSLLNDRLTIDVSANYIMQYNRNMINQGEYMNPLTSAYLMPRSETIESVRNFERFDAEKNFYVQTWTYGKGDYHLQNPYWVAYRNLRETSRERYMLMLNASYDIMKWSISDKWSISGRVRSDVTDIFSTDKRYATTEPTHDVSETGYYGEEKAKDRQTYADLISTFNKGFSIWGQSLNFNAVLGASVQDTRYTSSTVRGPLRETGLVNFFDIFNIDQAAKKAQTFPTSWIEQTQSIFGSLELGLNSYLYLTLTGRNDWASQLVNTPNPSFFYPSVGLSGVVTDMLSDKAKARIKSYLSYLKVRVAYASVASPFTRGLTSPTYSRDLDTKTYKNISHFPIGTLLPERTNSYEAGISSKWFNGLINFNVTYYRTNTYNQTIHATLSASSGYTGIYVQTGNIRNQGVESTLGLHLGDGDNLSFDSNITFGYNQNKIVELAENYTNPITGEKESKNELKKGAINGVSFRLRKGGTLGDIYTSKDFQRDANGNIVVGQNGTPSVENLPGNKSVKLGSVLPDYTIGWNNELNFKGFNLGVLISGRVGGIVVSQTEAALDYYGVSEASGIARNYGFVAVDDKLLDPQAYFTTRGKGAELPQYYTYSATNFRVQEAHIGYRIARKYLCNTADVTLSLYGRNLGFIYNKAPFDPEAIASTGNYAQGIDYFMMPSQRTFGVNLKLNF